MRFLFSALLVLSAPAFAASGEISGEVTAAKNVVLKPGGTLFIFAKTAGNPMPAAVIRLENPKLPHKFTLSAANAMVAGTPFEGPFTLTARYSPTGDAMDKSGPEGTVAKPVTVGTKDLKIELKSK